MKILNSLTTFRIPEIDLVIVDLYPFEETVKSVDDEEEIIEKIDIGGISLIRAAAKNFNDVLVVSGRDQYKQLLSPSEREKGIHFTKTGNIMRQKHSRLLRIMILLFLSTSTGVPGLMFSVKA